MKIGRKSHLKFTKNNAFFANFCDFFQNEKKKKYRIFTVWLIVNYRWEIINYRRNYSERLGNRMIMFDLRRVTAQNAWRQRGSRKKCHFFMAVGMAVIMESHYNLAMADGSFSRHFYGGYKGNPIIIWPWRRYVLENLRKRRNKLSF